MRVHESAPKLIGDRTDDLVAVTLDQELGDQLACRAVALDALETDRLHRQYDQLTS